MALTPISSVKAANIGKLAGKVEVFSAGGLPIAASSPKAQPIAAQTELADLKQAGLVTKGVDRFERLLKAASTPEAPQTLPKPKAKPASNGRVEESLPASKTSGTDKSHAPTEPPPTKQTSGWGNWREWFQLPYIPVVY